MTKQIEKVSAIRVSLAQGNITLANAKQALAKLNLHDKFDIETVLRTRAKQAFDESLAGLIDAMTAKSKKKEVVDPFSKATRAHIAQLANDSASAIVAAKAAQETITDTIGAVSENILDMVKAIASDMPKPGLTSSQFRSLIKDERQLILDACESAGIGNGQFMQGFGFLTKLYLREPAQVEVWNKFGDSQALTLGQIIKAVANVNRESKTKRGTSEELKDAKVEDTVKTESANSAAILHAQVNAMIGQLASIEYIKKTKKEEIRLHLSAVAKLLSN